MKQATTVLVRLVAAGAVSASLSGIAFASSIDLSLTGPDSSNQVTTQTDSQNTVSNTNTIQVSNTTVQDAWSGGVSTNGNTSVFGGSGSGEAANASDTTTVVSINNPAGGLGNGSTVSMGGSTTGGTTPISSGSVLGASTGGMGSGVAPVLPQVGASIPVDVSALRELYHPSALVQPAQAIVAHSKTISAAFLAMASVLSLIGAGMSMLISQRKVRQEI